MVEHTPGPWKPNPHALMPCGCDGGADGQHGRLIAQLSLPTTGDEARDRFLRNALKTFMEQPSEIWATGTETVAP